MNEVLDWRKLRRDFHHYFTVTEIHHNIFPDRHAQHPPFPVKCLAQVLDIDVRVTEERNWDCAVRITEQRPVVWLHSSLSLFMQRYAFAYCIGRILQSEMNSECRDILTFKKPADVPRHANDAYQFADDLLMPEWSIRITVDRLKDTNYVTTLASMYEVPDVAMLRRLQFLYGPIT